MHIPDGYLSPQTYLPAFAVMIPVWAYASKQVSRNLRSRQIPLLALGAAFSFVIMMFNVPIPGGTTGHAAPAVDSQTGTSGRMRGTTIGSGTGGPVRA